MEFGVSLYCRKVLIDSDPKNLLPDWLRFVAGRRQRGSASQYLTGISGAAASHKDQQGADQTLPQTAGGKGQQRT